MRFAHDLKNHGSMSSYGSSELADALKSCRWALVGVGLFSAMINILMLTGAFYMLQIYDRVLTSGSVPTLIALSVLAVFLLLMMGVLDMIRSRLLVRIGASLDQDLSRRIFDIVIKMSLSVGSRGDGIQPVRDLDAIRTFLASPGPAAFFDMPWMPIYIAIIFAFHPLLGITAIIGAAILIAITLLTEYLTRSPASRGAQFAQARNSLANASLRNAEVLTAMGMRGRLADLWRDASDNYVRSQINSSDVTGGFGAFSKALRMVLQSAMLGLGAYLVINQQASAGIIIAGAILAGRALAPIDQAIGQWRGFVAARHSWARLKGLLVSMPEPAYPMPLPAPAQGLSVEKVVAVPPGSQNPVLHGIGFRLKAGHSLGIIGLSGSGKSSLARLLVGAWQPKSGKILLDGTPIDQWSSEILGKSIGYMPQDIELFSGTIAQNISRFEAEASSDTIIKAAREAGVHEMITDLPGGYDTEIGERGQGLSSGQRQRIGLARALYGEPFLVVLDEPNSNLDSEGEQALVGAMSNVRDRGGIVILIAHRAGALANIDFLLVLNKGTIADHGARQEVLARLKAQGPKRFAKKTSVKTQD